MIEVTKVLDLALEGRTQKDIAAAIGYDRSNVSRILRRKSHKEAVDAWLEAKGMEYSQFLRAIGVPLHRRLALEREARKGQRPETAEILDLALEGHTTREIAEMVGGGYRNIAHIINRQVRKDEVDAWLEDRGTSHTVFLMQIGRPLRDRIKVWSRRLTKS